MRRSIQSVWLSLMIVLAPIGLAQQHEGHSDAYDAREQLAFSLGVMAYIYGFPLVRMEQVRRQSLAQTGVAVNEFRHRRRLTTPQDRTVVSPNNDTVYSSAWLDLTQEPLVLYTPDAGARYCSYAFYDAYTNNFKVISKRNARAGETYYAITAPQWKGTLPKGMTRVEAPTNSVWLLVRTLISDESDWPPVQALQEKMTIVPLSSFGKAVTTSKKTSAARSSSGVGNTSPLAFFEQMGALMKQNPPPANEGVLVNQFSKIGFEPAGGFNATRLDAAAKAGLERAIPAARKMIKTMKGDETLRRVNGWLVATKGGAFGDDYLFRAIIAEKGIGQLVPEEASYLVTDVDGEGKLLNGSNRYVLRFSKGQLPPAYEFWSLTLYAADFFFIENPIKRYAIGDRTRGLRYDADGSLTIYLQHSAPAGKESNWLPAPAGDFNLNLRAYLPKPELLNNSYQPPPIERVK